MEQTVVELEVKRPDRAFLVNATTQSVRTSESVAEDPQPDMVGAAADGQAAVMREPGSGRMSGFTVPAFKRLLSIELDEFADVESYVAGFMTLVRGLAEDGYEFGERMRVSLMLKGLPASCDALVEDLETSEMSFEAVTARIIEHVRMQEEIREEQVGWGR